MEAGDLLAALFQEPDSTRSRCCAARASRGSTCCSTSPTASRSSDATARSAGERQPGRGVGSPASARRARCPRTRSPPSHGTSPSAPAEGKLDPLIGRGPGARAHRPHPGAAPQEQPDLRRRDRRVGKTALAEGLALRIHEGRVPEDLQNAEIFSLDLGALLAGTRYRGDFEARFKALIGGAPEAEHPILFIDEIHTILGAGSAQGATVDASNLLKPLLAGGRAPLHGLDHLPGVPPLRARSRALAPLPEGGRHEPSAARRPVRILQGLAPRYEEHHGVRYTGRRPARRRRSLGAAPERPLPAGQGHRRDGRDRAPPCGCARFGQAPQDRRRARRRAVVARMANIPRCAHSAPASDRTEARGLEADLNLRKVVFGQDAAISTVVRAVKRARAGLGGVDRPIGLLPLHRPDRRGQDRARQAARPRWACRSCAST